MKLYIYLKNEKAMGLSVPVEAKWLVGNGNSIHNDYDFWLSVRSNVYGGNYPHITRAFDFFWTKLPHNESVH